MAILIKVAYHISFHVAIQVATWMLRSAKTLMHFFFKSRTYILNRKKFMKVQNYRVCDVVYMLFVKIELKYDLVFGVFETGLVLWYQSKTNLNPLFLMLNRVTCLILFKLQMFSPFKISISFSSLFVTYDKLIVL